MRQVKLIRRLRDGTQTEEVMTEYLALLTVAAVPTPDGEPNVASIRIVPIGQDSGQFVKRLAQRQADIALAMAGAWDSTRQETVQ